MRNWSEDPESTYVDQMTSGINFVTKRPREEVIEDFLWVLEETYSTRRYFDRCLNVSLTIRVKGRHKRSFSRKLQYLSGFLKTVIKLGLPLSTAYYYWRNIFAVAFTRASSLETLLNLMAVYLHLGPHSKFVSRLMREKLRELRSRPPDVAEGSQPGGKRILFQPPPVGPGKHHGGGVGSHVGLVYPVKSSRLPQRDIPPA